MMVMLHSPIKCQQKFLVLFQLIWWKGGKFTHETETTAEPVHCHDLFQLGIHGHTNILTWWGGNQKFLLVMVTMVLLVIVVTTMMMALMIPLGVTIWSYSWMVSCVVTVTCWCMSAIVVVHAVADVWFQRKFILVKVFMQFRNILYQNEENLPISPRFLR